MGENKSSVESTVRVSGVSKVFGHRNREVRALDNLSLDVQPGEVVVLLGPSGCGKTTLLRSIAGLQTIDRGEIAIEGKTVFSSDRGINVLPEHRNTSMVFQSYALWPHLTIWDNVAYPLKSRRAAKSSIAARVEEALRVVGCSHLKDRHPHQLSGGQQQRIALARAIVGEQSLVLFDEPLSNVDAKVRDRLRVEIVALQRKLRFSAVYVTHDQTEAMVVGSRIAVMGGGRIAQIGTPAQIYNEPADRYVADFVGTANFIPGTLRGRDGELMIVETPLGDVAASSSATPLSTGDAVTVFFRPENCQIGPAGAPAARNSWQCGVDAELYLGPNRELILSCLGHRLVAWLPSAAPPVADRALTLAIAPGHVRLLPADKGGDNAA